MSKVLVLRLLACYCYLFMPAASLCQINPHAEKPKSAEIQGHYFASIPMLKGLPAFPPISRQFSSEQQHAALQFADTLGTLYICSGKGTDGQGRYFLVHHRYDQNWSMSSVMFSAANPDTLQAFEDLTPLAGRETPFPMDLRIVPSSRTLLFRWLLSPDDPNIPGGIPTAANVLLDVGKQLFDFTVTDLAGHQVRSAELRGKITVVDWWAISCSACIAEMPGFNKLVQKFASDVDFVAIAMNTTAQVTAFLSTHEFHFRQTVSEDSMYRLIGSGIPRTVVLDDHGVVRFDHAGGGPDSYKEFDQAITALLAKKEGGR